MVNTTFMDVTGEFTFVDVEKVTVKTINSVIIRVVDIGISYSASGRK